MKHAFSIALVAIILLFDQVSKFFVLSGTIDTIHVTSFLNIVNVWNDGIAFGFFSDSGFNGNLFFTFITGVIILVFGYLLFKARSNMMISTYALIMGGALGNLIDRLRYKAVFDFIDFHCSSYHWPAFNIADAAICIGGFMLLWHFFGKNTGIKVTNRSLILVALLTTIISINGCSGDTKKKLGLNRPMPDESKVSTRPDLSVPPNFNLPVPEDEEEALKSPKVAPKKPAATVTKPTKSEGLTASDKELIEKFDSGKK